MDLPQKQEEQDGNSNLHGALYSKNTRCKVNANGISATEYLYYTYLTHAFEEKLVQHRMSD